MGCEAHGEAEAVGFFGYATQGAFGSSSCGDTPVEHAQVGGFVPSGDHGCDTGQAFEVGVAVAGPAGFGEPADSCIPGHTPIQEIRCRSVANWAMFLLVSAR